MAGHSCSYAGEVVKVLGNSRVWDSRVCSMLGHVRELMQVCW